MYIHLYIHTYIHTHIYTYIHTCSVQAALELPSSPSEDKGTGLNFSTQLHLSLAQCCTSDDTILNVAQGNYHSFMYMFMYVYF